MGAEEFAEQKKWSESERAPSADARCVPRLRRLGCMAKKCGLKDVGENVVVNCECNRGSPSTPRTHGQEPT